MSAVANIGPCQTCGTEADLFVYALPGIPMSVGHCRNCFIVGAYPLYIAKANTEAIGGMDAAAEWWRQSITYVPGKGYTPIVHALKGEGPQITHYVGDDCEGGHQEEGE